LNDSLNKATLVLEVAQNSNEKDWHGTDLTSKNVMNSRIYEACFIDVTTKSYTTYIWNRSKQSAKFQAIVTYILPIKPPLSR
ncbi:MAG: hypothetical protein ACPG3Z_07045, partial [Saprospiraceae bacterium]